MLEIDRLTYLTSRGYSVTDNKHYFPQWFFGQEQLWFFAKICSFSWIWSKSLMKGINSKGKDAFFNSIKKCYPATSTNKESGNTFFALTYNHGKRLVCKISVINRLQFKGHSQNSWLDDLILCSCYFLCFIFQRIIIEALL